MKKFIYLCGMMLLSLNMMAQIDLNDRNWDTILIENFDSGLVYWQWDTLRFLNTGDYSWKGFMGNSIVTNGEHQVYQYDNCQINTSDRTMNLVAYYDSTQRIQRNKYRLPKCMLPEYNGSGFPPSDGLYYFSGAIEYYKDHYVQDENDRKFLYGYFEIRCKLPTHQGAFPAFWLHGASQNSADPYYEEIDIFEYSWSNGDPNAFWLHPNNPNPTYAGDPHIITCGIYHNLIGESPNIQHPDSYGRVYPGNLPDVNADFHVYGCEWMPDHVYWYFDGQLINAYTDVAHIPCHPLTLKTNYAINNYAGKKINNVWQPEWFGSDIMTIDYIDVYQLQWDCQTDEIIASQSDLDDFDYAVKKNIYITSTINEPIVSNTDNVTFRVTDSFEITGVFEVQQGGKFTVIMQECPNDDNE